MKKKRKKEFNKTSKYNPVFQARALEKLRNDISRLDMSIQALSISHDNHILYLGNFARHDVKNAILSMDSILTTSDPEEFDTLKIDSLITYLNVIRQTMDNFARLVPYSTNGKFKLDTLLIAAELLSRSNMQQNGIDFKLSFPRNSDHEINMPFQALLQMINNLIINSVKALEGVNNKKILVEADFLNDNFWIKLSDNGSEISPVNATKIFDYGFSTTGGSGIGLYHAKYLSDQFNGQIKVDLDVSDGYTKTFCITLPKTK